MKMQAMTKRGLLFVETEDYEKADLFFEKALDEDPEDAYAYIGKLLIDLKLHKISELGSLIDPFWINRNYELAIRFSDEDFKQELYGYVNSVNETINQKEQQKIDVKYGIVIKHLETANSIEDYENVINEFKKLGVDVKNSKEKIAYCETKILEIKYSKAIEEMTKVENLRFPTEYDYLRVAEAFEILDNYKDSTVKKSRYQQLSEKAHEERMVREAEEKRIRLESETKEKIRKKKITIFITIFLAIGTVIACIYGFVIQPSQKYNSAMQLYNESKYTEAAAIFNELENYKNSIDYYKKCEEIISQGILDEAIKLIDDKKYSEAIEKISTVTYEGYTSNVTETKMVLVKKVLKDEDYKTIISLIENSDEEYGNLVKNNISNKQKNIFVDYIRKNNKLSYYSMDAFNNSAKKQIDLMKKISYSESYYTNLNSLYGYIKAIKDADNYKYGFKENLDNIKSLWSFEPTQELMQSDDCIKYFLVGKWYTDDGDGYTYDEHYIEFYYNDKDGISTQYNIPYTDDSDFQYYDIRNMKYVYTRDKDDKTKDNYKLTLLSADSMKVYSYKDGKTYTVYRD